MELLVVVAIIVVVAALLFPVFSAAREATRRSACQSNMRQYASAYQLYAADHDETFPLVTTPFWVTTPADSRPPLPPSAIRTSYWANAIQPYIRDYRIYRCPSTLEGDWLGANNDPLYAFSYTYNGLLTQYPLAGVVSPARCILQMEGLGNWAVRGFTMTNPVIEEPNCRDLYDPLTSRCSFYGGINLGYQIVEWNMGHHDLGSNVLYVDGHVRWVRHPSEPERGGIFATFQPGGGFSYWWDGRCPTNFRPIVE